MHAIDAVYKDSSCKLFAELPLRVGGAPVGVVAGLLMTAAALRVCMVLFKSIQMSILQMYKHRCLASCKQCAVASQLADALPCVGLVW
jgi:hypothetical protein